MSSHRSNIKFPAPGNVQGSKENATKEEIFLCDRLMQDIAKRRTMLDPKIHWYSWNYAVTSVLQGFRRPVCGLVALCMAGEMLENKEGNMQRFSDSELLDIAQKNGYTIQGEMFSAENYAKLASEIYRCESVVLEKPLLKSMQIVIHHLAKGLPILVPYDTDRNHEPCLRKGHKAHWAILTGVVLGTREPFGNKPNHNGVERVKNPMTLFDSATFKSAMFDPSMVYVYAKQGKSARQQLWSLKSISVSNANLKEADPNRDFNRFKVPSEGLKQSLCTKSVLLYSKNDAS